MQQSDTDSRGVENMGNIEKTIQKNKSPLVFISHDTRDAELAEQFSKLLSSVSAGVLKSFRSSDKRGMQGIEYGLEWYPEIMKKLDEATDVVCLLTPNSTNRPWILYEAGVAKGKLNTTLLGVVLGIPLSMANNGPFAQFQNCADDEDSLSKLVMQLVKKIPNSEPEIDIIKFQVNKFLNNSKELTASKASINELQKENTDIRDESSVAKLFEEIKLMYKELPSKIERRTQPNFRRHNVFKMNPGMLEDFLYSNRFKNIGFQVVLSLFKNDFPWIYEMGMELLKQSKIRGATEHSIRRNSIKKQAEEFRGALEFTFEHPAMVEMGYASIGYQREYLRIISRFIDSILFDDNPEQLSYERITDNNNPI